MQLFQHFVPISKRFWSYLLFVIKLSSTNPDNSINFCIFIANFLSYKTNSKRRKVMFDQCYQIAQLFQSMLCTIIKNQIEMSKFRRWIRFRYSFICQDTL